MWLRRSHTFVYLTILTSIKKKFKWTQVKQDAFKKIKQIVACDTLSAYPDFNERFKIISDASAFQLGEFMIQKGKPIAFYSRKLTDPQQWHTVIEREILSIAENLKEFRTILLGQKIIIHNDHKNNTFKFLIPIDY